MRKHQRVQEHRSKLLQLVEVLSNRFVGRQREIQLMVTAAVAGEPLLFLGEPGTGKSDLVRQFCRCLGLKRNEYFEYLLTKFTEPAELLGPIDIQSLREGKYVRRIEGKLPEAKVVFLDEIFQSNSAILNHLLTIIQERRFYQDGLPKKVEMEILFGASNGLPSLPELKALKDRFPLKVQFFPVHRSCFQELIIKGSVNEIQSRWDLEEQVVCSLEAILDLRKFLDTLIFGEKSNRGELWQRVEEDMQNYWEEGVFKLFEDILQALEKDLHLHITDRKVIKLYRLLRTYAFLFHGGTVQKEDLFLLQYIGDEEEDLLGIAEYVQKILGI